MFGRLIFDLELESFLSRNAYDKVAMLLANGNSSIINEVGNFIKREEGDLVSYLPKSKYGRVREKTFDGYTEDPYSNGIGRVTIKIGRFVNKFLRRATFESYNISPQDLESFVNLYKSYFLRSEANLKIVEGLEILKWYTEYSYHHDNGNRFGTLWNSCMRQMDRNIFMSLYADNKDIRMLILLADDGKLLGRALLWDKVIDRDGNEFKFMDRVYTMYDHDVNIFKNWAKENGFIHKMEQSARSERIVIKYVDGSPVPCNMQLYVTLENHKQNYYPYLDTFKFYDPIHGIFSNSDEYREGFILEYVLVQSNGGLVPPEPECDEPEFYEEEYDDH